MMKIASSRIPNNSLWFRRLHQVPSIHFLLVRSRRTNVADRLEAKAFILKDEDGKIRAALQMDKSVTGDVIWTGPQLVLFDSNGRTRFSVSFESRGDFDSTELELFESTGHDAVVSISSHEESFVGNQQTIHLMNKDGATIDLSASPGQARIEIFRGQYYPASSAVMFAGTGSRGFHVSAYHPGKVEGYIYKRLDMFVKDEKPRITIYDKDERPVFSKP